MDAARRLTLTVTPPLAGQKVDTLLRQVLGLSGTVIRRIKWLEDGILLDGIRVFTSQVVQPGQTLSVRLTDPESVCAILPTPGALDIIYEDEDILVICKAPGVPSHPSPGHFSDTLGNYVSHYYKTTGISAQYHPVHRLDRGTSGLMVVAKHPHAQEQLKLALHTPDFQRVYLAVCDGVPSPATGVVDAPIARQPDSIIGRVVAPDGQWARTQYEVLRTANGRALLRLVLETGRTHQIRVHMAHLGCPLTGDFLYGTEDLSLITRHALHAAELSLRQPLTGVMLSLSAPLPEDMAALLR